MLIIIYVAISFLVFQSHVDWAHWQQLELLHSTCVLLAFIFVVVDGEN